MKMHYGLLFLFWIIFGCQSTLPLHMQISEIRSFTMKATSQTSTEDHYVLSRESISNILYSKTPVLDLYNQDATHEIVLEFFTTVTGSQEITVLILRYAQEYRLPALTVFALAWVESQFDVYATNGNPNSTDRGLFQLNSKTFRNLRIEDFYNPETNIHHGIAYLRQCLNQAGDIETALAIYNAGAYRVLQGMTPQITQRHVWRIQNHEKLLYEQFSSFILDRIDVES